MSLTNVNVTRDKDGNVHAHWVGTVTFNPSIQGDPHSFQSLIKECVEDFERQLTSEINTEFTS